MKRRLFRPTVLLSLALLTTIAGLWIRSYWYAEGVSFHNFNGEIILGYNVGRVQLNLSNLGLLPAGVSCYRAEPLSWERVSLPSLAGFSCHTVRSQRSDIAGPTTMPSGLVLRPLEVTRVITVPFALPAILFATLLGWALRRRQSIPGCCPTCGYDLRATPDCCPECGTTFLARGDA
jgi:hypothetical protein